MGAPSLFAVYQAEKSTQVPNAGSVLRLPQSFRKRAALRAPSVIPARLPWAATIAPFTTAARPATTTALAATDMTPGAATTRVTEVTASTVAPTPADTLSGYLVGIGASGPDEAQRGGHEGGAAELHRLTARDRAGVQAHR
jgi:hypothetical protein